MSKPASTVINRFVVADQYGHILTTSYESALHKTRIEAMAALHLIRQRPECVGLSLRVVNLVEAVKSV